MALVQQTRELEKRLLALEERLGDGASSGVREELDALRALAERVPELEADRRRVDVLETAAAEWRNQGDPRPRLDDLSRRLSAAEAALTEADARSRRLEERLEAEVARRRMSPLRGLAVIGCGAAAYAIASSQGVASSMALSIAVAVAFGITLLVRMGD